VRSPSVYPRIPAPEQPFVNSDERG